MQRRARRVAREEDSWTALGSTRTHEEKLKGRFGSLAWPVFRQETVLAHPELGARSAILGPRSELLRPRGVRSVHLGCVKPVGGRRAVRTLGSFRVIRKLAHIDVFPLAHRELVWRRPRSGELVGAAGVKVMHEEVDPGKGESVERAGGGRSGNEVL